MPCSPGMRSCKASCLHRQSVLAYRLEREHQEQVADAESIGYATEREEWLERHPLITFRDWLIGLRRSRRDEHEKEHAA